MIDIISIQRRDSDGAIITQFDMSACETLGLLKMDFLGCATFVTISWFLTWPRSALPKGYWAAGDGEHAGRALRPRAGVPSQGRAGPPPGIQEMR